MVSLLLVMPASYAADKLGRKWTIVPSCIGLAAALGLMAAAGESGSLPSFQHWLDASGFAVRAVTTVQAAADS